jgi:ADP-ribosylglycohydrolase
MRVAPIGIAAQGNPQLAANWARQDAQLTHPHPVCVEANAAFAAAIAVGVAGGSRKEIFDSALEQLADDEHENVIRECLLAAARGEVVGEFQWQMGWVLIAFQNAFYQLMRGACIEEAVVNTVMSGGDTDTNASIVGALIGAATGLNAFPLKWALCLRSNRALVGVKARPAFLWPDDVSELAGRVGVVC